MLSGGRDSVCLLDLAVRLLGPEAVTALHVNYGLREDAGADERHCAGAVRAARGAARGRAARRPEGPGNLQAWAREVRYAAAAAPRRRRPGAAIATGHTADDQVETILYRLASSPSRRALLGMRAQRRAPGAAAARLHPGADDRLLRGARARLARRRQQRGAGLRPQPRPPRARRRRSPRSTRRRRPTCCARPSCCARRPRCSTPWSPPSSTAPAARRRDAISLERLGELPPALRRLVVQQLADRAAGRPVAGAARHAEEVAALRRTGTAMLDLGSGVRAVVERGVLRGASRPR